ncbi:MAG: nucleotidyltransferase [Candidatus Hydrogenedens sp.]|nr:nucleotidyltransferase [Candidatus Hydrogenedens sp.]
MDVEASRREGVLEELRRLKPHLSGRYGVTRLGVFGSVARGQATDSSDVDIVVEMTPNLFRRASVKHLLERELGRSVDVVRYSASMNAALRERIDREALFV